MRKVESWGPGIIPDKWGDVDPGGESSKSRGFRGGQRRRRSLGPGVIPGGMGQHVIQADGDPIPGNSQRCDARHKFPRRRRRRSLGPGVIPGGMGQR